MPINSTHAEYDASASGWSRARDVLAGEDAVKAAGERYLPRLDSQSDEEYSAYRARASFFGATARTVEEYLDLIFRRAPTIGVGERKDLQTFLGDCDLWGLDFVRFARHVVREVLSLGRSGSLVLADDAQRRPWVSSCRAEDILNWSVDRMDGRTVLASVVLRDAGRLRVMRLETQENIQHSTLNAQPHQCVQEFWRPAGGSETGSNSQSPIVNSQGEGAAIEAEGNSQSPIGDSQGGESASEAGWMLEERVTLKRDGVPLSFIPFVFHGPRSSRPDPERLPLAEIIAANLDHYRLDADLKHGLHFAALPTAWVSGFDKATPLRIGSSAAWVSDIPGATAGFLEFTGAGLAHLERAMEKVEQRMAALGAEMLNAQHSTPNIQHSTLNAQLSTPSCGLGSIVASLNQSLTRVLQLAAWWVEGGDLDRLAAGAISFTMNTDLEARAMSGEDITAVVAAWRAGAISRETMLERLKRGDVLPDGRTVAQERALIHQGPVRY